VSVRNHEMMMGDGLMMRDELMMRDDDGLR